MGRLSGSGPATRRFTVCKPRMYEEKEGVMILCVGRTIDTNVHNTNTNMFQPNKPFSFIQVFRDNKTFCVTKLDSVFYSHRLQAELRNLLTPLLIFHSSEAKDRDILYTSNYGFTWPSQEIDDVGKSTPQILLHELLNAC
jgi:hypothetical protein